MQVQRELDDAASTDVKRHVIGCHATESMRVQSALNDAMGGICQAMP
jgi:hypothetical protein